MCQRKWRLQELTLQPPHSLVHPAKMTDIIRPVPISELEGTTSL